MYNKLVDFQNSKLSWFILMIGSFSLLGCSLFFQHILLLEPCVLCIYQRIGIILIFISSLIPLVIGTSKYKLIPSYLIWIPSSALGLWAAVKQWEESYMAAKNPFYMSQCGQGLEQYFPSIEKSEFLSNLFIARGICSEIDWSFLGLKMHHYMTFIFAIFLLAGIVFLAANLIGKKKGA